MSSGVASGPERALVLAAANGSKEPNLPDAAACTNDRFLGAAPKSDEIKGSFATGFWHKTCQRFRRHQLL
jgi:hypothetical protein